MTNETVFLLLGSNLGERKQNIEHAITHLERLIGVIAQKSSLYSTEAWGKTDQPDFYNQVIAISTVLPPEEVLKKILDIEASMGRKRIEKWRERVIDIDILLYGNQTVRTESLQIPHPEMANRRFTMVPLNEIAANVIHPTYHKSMRELLYACPDQLSVTKVEED